ENLDVLYVIGVDVDHAVWRRGPLELSSDILAANSGTAGVDRIEVGRRKRIVGDRNTVDNEEWLDVTVQGAETSDLDARIGARVPRGLRDLDVWRLSSEC